MQRTIKLVCSAVFVTLVLSIGFVPATSAEANVCVSVNGVNYVHLGTAGCESTEGNTAVTIGDGYSYSGYGEGNTSVAVGEFAYAETYNGDNNTAVATGYNSIAASRYGDQNTAVGAGGGGSSYAYANVGDSNTAVAVGEGSTADIYLGDGNGLIVFDEGYHSINNVNGCFAVIIDGQVYGDEDCLD